MNDFGICWDGLEEPMRNLVRRAAELPPAGPVVYIETGIAEGRTFAAICHTLESTGKLWKAFGVDLETGWSLDRAALAANIEHLPNATISLDGADAFLDRTVGPVHIMLIDDCHETPCVRTRFLQAEPLMAPGGIIVFHDADPGCQGLDPQPHHGQPIGVRQALLDLGLLGNLRPGWSLIEDIVLPPPGARGYVAVQKFNPQKKDT